MRTASNVAIINVSRNRGEVTLEVAEYAGIVFLNIAVKYTVLQKSMRHNLSQ